MNVYLLVGLPGAGKSTWAKANCKDAIIICKDMLRTMVNAEYIFDHDKEYLIYEWVESMLASALTDGRYNIIMDETHLTKRIRQRYIEIVRKTDYKVVIVNFAKGNNLDNRMKDPRGYDREHWSSIIDMMETIFEPVTPEEGYDEIR